MNLMAPLRFTVTLAPFGKSSLLAIDRSIDPIWGIDRCENPREVCLSLGEERTYLDSETPTEADARNTQSYRGLNHCRWFGHKGTGISVDPLRGNPASHRAAGFSSGPRKRKPDLGHWPG